jgi:hypothetical protein
MKNIHILPTDKPSRLVKIKDNLFYTTTENIPGGVYQHIYITSDEEIKEGDWYCSPNGIVSKHNGTEKLPDNWNKIILTTDQDLIKNGVQAIDDEFLEWFVKNPSCQEVKVADYGNVLFDDKVFHMYKIIIPKEEPKQETTLEEAAKRIYGTDESKDVEYYAFILGAKWQAERMYSEEEVLDILYKHTEDLLAGKKVTLEEWFKEFKK